MSSTVVESPEEYLARAPEAGREWLGEFWQYLAERSPSLKPVMFRQVPMYRFSDSYLKGYVMFTAARNHFSVHALDFDLVEAARNRIPGAFGGKGSVSVKYANTQAKAELRRFVDEVLERHGWRVPED